MKYVSFLSISLKSLITVKHCNFILNLKYQLGCKHILQYKTLLMIQYRSLIKWV